MIPGAAVTTDVIAGFPGETGAEFSETLEFCREMRFARIHVFPFSPRPGTAAAAMPGRVPDAVRKERAKSLLALAGEVARSFREQRLGEKVEVLWEQCAKGIWTGLTGSHIRVYTKSSGDLADKLGPVKLIKLYRDGVWGEV
jgi:threonylcarbamoyladenosine tRNA methylthiotransferase MtaB